MGDIYSNAAKLQVFSYSEFIKKAQINLVYPVNFTHLRSSSTVYQGNGTEFQKLAIRPKIRKPTLLYAFLECDILSVIPEIVSSWRTFWCLPRYLLYFIIWTNSMLQIYSAVQFWHGVIIPTPLSQYVFINEKTDMSWVTQNEPFTRLEIYWMTVSIKCQVTIIFQVFSKLIRCLLICSLGGKAG